MPGAPLPPRILLAIPAQWPRALLRASLREMGYDASGTRSLTMLLHHLEPEPERGPIRLVVLDQDALTEVDQPQLEALNSAAIPILLLAPALRPVREGLWAGVIRRPVSLGDVVQAIEQLLPLASEARRPID